MTDDEFDAGPPRRPTPEERAWVFESSDEERARFDSFFAKCGELGRRMAEEQNRRVMAAILNAPAGSHTHTTYATGATMPAPTVESLLATMKAIPKPEPEQVIITPSLDALREAVPFELDPTGRRTLDGIRVVVTKHADRPRLFPAADLHLLGFGIPAELIGQPNGDNYAAAWLDQPGHMKVTVSQTFTEGK